jgi:hypothetical protein
MYASFDAKGKRKSPAKMETKPTAINNGSQTRNQLESELYKAFLTKSKSERFTRWRPEHRVIPINSILAIQSYFGKGYSKASELLFL